MLAISSGGIRLRGRTEQTHQLSIPTGSNTKCK